MKYTALLYGEPDAGPVQGTPEFMQMLGEFQPATEAMAKAGILVDSGPLQPPRTAAMVWVRAVREHITSQVTALAAAPAEEE